MVDLEGSNESPGRADESRIRVFFFIAALLGGTLFWIAPRPPMGDLPQHAGQVALLRDLLEGRSRWSDLVSINYLTPYVMPFALATTLSTVLPVVTSLKVVLTLSYFGFVAAAVALRREFGGDPRLDFLFLPGFFGLSFQFGFFAFLVATPAGLYFLLLARRYAKAPARARGLGLVLAGIAVFFSHGLVFLFCAGVGFGMLATGLRREDLGRVLPYVALGSIAVAYSIVVRVHDPVFSHVSLPIDWEWNHSWGWHRIPAFIDYVTASTLHDAVFYPAVLLMLAAPFALGDRPSPDRSRWVPFGAIVLVWLLVPAGAMDSTYLYQRFAVYLLPTYALLFRPASGPSARSTAVQGALAVLCVAFFGSVALRERRFARESAPFETVLAAAHPGERALSVIFSPESESSHHPYAYHTYPLWYEVEKGGFVDFNFAYFPPEVVRFRRSHAPPLHSDVESFDWRALHASSYKYFFLRHEAPLSPHLFDNEECRVSLVRKAGDWELYERRQCR